MFIQGSRWLKKWGFTGAITLVLLTLVCGVVQADAVDNYVRSQVREQRIPGLTLAIVKNGQTVRSVGYGIADLEWDAPATGDTVYELASLSKQFTATAIMMLVEAGKVKLDNPVTAYFDDLPAEWSAVTVRHLLTHTSGLPEFYFNLTRLSSDRTLRAYNTQQQREDIAKYHLSFPPGTRAAYSNTGFELLGMIVEKASGDSYETFLQQHIFTPLGMEHTYFVNEPRIIHHRATGYTLRSGTLVRHSLTTLLGALTLNAFGGLLSTVGDLARWDAALRSEKLLKSASLAQMCTPAQLGDGQPATLGQRHKIQLGFGWFLDTWRGHRLVYHTGHTGTAILRLPDDGLTVIVLSNLGDGNPPPVGTDQGGDPERIARGVLALLVPETTPKKATALPAH